MNTSLDFNNCTDYQIDELMVEIAQERYNGTLSMDEVKVYLTKMPIELQRRIGGRILTEVLDPNFDVKKSFSDRIG